MDVAGWLLPPGGVVIYYANPVDDATRAAITAGVLGCMVTPGQGNRIDHGWQWAIDNGCFIGAGGTIEAQVAGEPPPVVARSKGGWRPSTWIAALEKWAPYRDGCRFAVVPDAVGDATETARLWRIWRPVVAELGYPPAYALQDGADTLPWDEFTVLFVGGTTAYKCGPDAWRITSEARARGKWVHWGRVNSKRRFAMAALSGDSADGTYLTFGPRRNLPRLLAWTNTLPL